MYVCLYVCMFVGMYVCMDVCILYVCTYVLRLWVDGWMGEVLLCCCCCSCCCGLIVVMAPTILGLQKINKTGEKILKLRLGLGDQLPLAAQFASWVDLRKELARLQDQVYH